MEASITFAEQARRKALKQERKNIERTMSHGKLVSLRIDSLPSRWSWERRQREAARSAEQADRAARARIGSIDKDLATRPRIQTPTFEVR